MDSTRGRIAFAVIALSAAGFIGMSAAAEGGATAELGEGLYAGAAISVECATVWPVYTRDEIADVGDDFVSLAEAQAAGEAEIRETGASAAERDPGRRAPNDVLDVGGAVNTLVIENRGARPILVLAGTLLKGGKQDRQVGQDFVVPPTKTVAADAFCVEHGRWVAEREGVRTGGAFEAKKSLATKSVRKKAQFESDQSGVWEEVARENARAGKSPASGTLLATVEDADARTAARRASVENRVRAGLAAERARGLRPVGIAYAVGGKVREVRVFTHPRIFDRFEETLVATVALEELQARRAVTSEKACRAGDVAQVVALVKGASSPSAAAKARKVETKAGSVNELRDGNGALSSECLPTAESKKGVTKSFMYAD